MFLLLMIIPACSSSNKLSNSQIQPTLLDYSITISQGGGFTGGYQGYLIDSTGTISSFESMLTYKSQRVRKGILSEARIMELNKLFTSIINIKFNENGNMTTSVMLSNGGHKLSFSWPGVEPGVNVPSELVQFYKKINNIINHLEK
jgi:hypothetical protein